MVPLCMSVSERSEWELKAYNWPGKVEEVLYQLSPKIPQV
jgi:hypothetical protein